MPLMQSLSMRLGKSISLGGARKLSVDLNIFNVFNNADALDWDTGAHQSYNTVAFGQPGGLQRSRSYELDATFRF